MNRLRSSLTNGTWVTGALVAGMAAFPTYAYLRAIKDDPDATTSASGPSSLTHPGSLTEELGDQTSQRQLYFKPSVQNLLNHAIATTQMESSAPSLSSASTTNNNNDITKLIFLGTGSSTGCPRPLCPLIFAPPPSPGDDGNQNQQPDEELLKMQGIMAPFCRTSNLAVEGGNPASNKDYRNNPSFLIATKDGNVIIDVGKTFREGALRWLPKNQIRSIDAIILTHEHMDAAGGLDDVRGFQKYVRTSSNEEGEEDRFHVNFTQVPMPLFLSGDCLHKLRDEFPWLLPREKKQEQPPIPTNTDEKPVVNRHVASFDVTVFDDSFQPIFPLKNGDLRVTPLPVMHGEDLVSFGFAFTVGGGTYNVVYLSDISRMLPETLDFILTKLPQPTHLLVLDALLVDRTNPVHFNLVQAMELVEHIRPEQTYLVGMNCDSFDPHDAMNQRLRNEYQHYNVQLAHDGLVINVPNTTST